MQRPLTLALSLALLAPAAPALAVTQDPGQRPQPVLGLYQPNPWLAGALSASAPLVFAVGLGAFPSTDMLGAPHLLALGLAGLALGSGHAYAGDPLRGAAVGAGGLGIVGLGVGGIYLASLTTPPNSGAQAGMGTLLLGLGLTTLAGVGYSGWAAYDAHQTAERRNQPR